MSGSIGVVTRLTSRNLKIEFKPVLHPDFRSGAYASYETPMNHVTVISTNGATSGTFKLSVNGHRTGAITVSASLPTVAGLQTILDAVTPAGSLVVSGTPGSVYTLTAALTYLNQFQIIEIVEDATVGGTGVTQAITTQGSDFIDISSPLNSFSYSDSQESVDVTGISEQHRRHASTVDDATWEMSIYEALQSYRMALSPGIEGFIRVFEDGKLTGHRYFVWEVMLTDIKPSFKAFDKVELAVSGRRQGASIVRVGSYY